MFVDRPVGIDLGTTNSEVAVLDPSERDLLVLADRFGRRTVPSAVAWDPKAERVVVGRAARNRRGQSPGPIESIKRSMGRDLHVAVGPHQLTPEEVSAKILEELRTGMQRHLAERAGDDVEVRVARAVVTVPAYFDAPQIEATRKAGELAGLEMLGILQEPTAAAIYHTWREKLGDGNFLVYDLGGGTFDVSILRCLAGEYQVVAIDGDNFLGGDDFDRRYAEHLRKQLVDRGYALALDVQENPDDRERFQRLVHLAQQIKESLSTAEVVPFSQQAVLEDQDGERVDFDEEVSRASWERGVADLVETTLACCRRAVAESEREAGIGLADIDHVVLVGGSTRVPLVARAVTEQLASRCKNATPLQDEVDTCVALGAAIHAAQRGGLRLGTRTSTVTVRSPLVGSGRSLALRVDVDRADPRTRSLRIETADASAEVPVDGIPAEGLRLDAPLGPDEENPTTLVFSGPDGESLDTLPLALYRGDARPRASALSQPSVVAKDISVEVSRGGRRERRVLLKKGTGLPAEATDTFFTGDRSGAVVLRLLQNRLPIKTLMIQVEPDLPVGTPVSLSVRCDETMRIEAKAVVAGQELWATVESARQKLPGAEEVDALIARAEATATALWGHDAAVYRREVEPLLTAIREVIGTDPAKLAALCATLETLLDSFGGRPGELSPSMLRFESVMDALRRTVFRAEGSMLGMDTAGWESRISELTQRGIEAWEQSDAGEWRRVNNEAQALQETASEQEFSRMKVEDPAYLAKRLLGVRSFASRVQHALSDFVPSATDDVRALQLAERDRLQQTLVQTVHRPLEGLVEASGENPHEMRRQLDQIVSELRRIDAALEKLPSIGLVTERGVE